MVNLPSIYMQQALDKAFAYQGLTFPNPPVGSIVCDNNYNFISSGVHECAGFAHAEVNAIKSAYQILSDDNSLENEENANLIHEYLYKNHNGIFNDKIILVTLEPCNHYGKTPPCSHLIKELGFKKVIIGTRDLNTQASGGIEYLKGANINVEVGLLEEKCSTLMEPFNTWQKDTFVFFKVAMSNNGVIDGGFISSNDSRTLVHKLRDKIDLLVIGGNTVRIDRPTLDARLCNGRAPDILIVSQKNDFDRDIPLFNIPNRAVHVEDNFDKIKEYKFAMIEGGDGMFELTKNIVSHYLIFRSPHFKIGHGIQNDLKLKEIFSMNIGEDRLSWFKKKA